MDFFLYFNSIHKKKVKFSNFVKIILIPTRTEYNNLSHFLWWNEEDYKLFKISAVNELNEIVKRHHGTMTYSHASKILYQPNITYDKSNFY
jgi:hypothetical protein